MPWAMDHRIEETELSSLTRNTETKTEKLKDGLEQGWVFSFPDCFELLGH